MKKLFLAAVSLILVLNVSAVSEAAVQKLTRTQCSEYNLVNKAVARAFENLPQQIDTSVYPPLFLNFGIIPYDKTQSPSFYYVKQGSAELLYDKASKELRYVSFKKSSTPRTYAIYNYPSGRLRQVDVWLYLNEVFSFNSDGVYINYKDYIKSIRKTIVSNIVQPEKKKKLCINKNWKKTKTSLVITINYKGEIEQCIALQQSDDEDFNKRLYEAIWKSSPFSNVPYPFVTRTIDVKLEF